MQRGACQRLKIKKKSCQVCIEVLGVLTSCPGLFRLVQFGYSEKTFSVDGTPTDCIKLAINKIMKNNPPDLLLSGINRGGNLACDIAYSGTVAAAVEGTLLGIPSIALSQVIFDNDDHRKDDWSSAENYTEHVIKQIINISRPSDVLINVNFPPVPSINVSGLAVGYQDKLEFSDEIETVGLN